MAIERRKNNFQPDWLGKTLAAVFPGLAFAFVCVGFYAWYGPGDIHSGNKTQFHMWLFTPIWLGVLSVVYLFKSARQAWLTLGSITVLLYAVFFLLRSVA
ncbi:MAG: hypothetical protein KJ930_05565 [Gammaproteobacteria bacterium]|jgi:hypothetical protein|nr:hypothetical protein [Gammaproteobacteria bacterium]MBU2178888.1 hypothetical protein [Gammaproteobacteria bacterium]MBU2224212.1 hypothetical protein [Gammaproteobacteria bacterium]MBU2425359.1 hypothetical protein [Gammaproteobacteria bacterium]